MENITGLYSSNDQRGTVRNSSNRRNRHSQNRNSNNSQRNDDVSADDDSSGSGRYGISLSSASTYLSNCSQSLVFLGNYSIASSSGSEGLYFTEDESSRGGTTTTTNFTNKSPEDSQYNSSSKNDDSCNTGVESIDEESQVPDHRRNSKEQKDRSIKKSIRFVETDSLAGPEVDSITSSITGITMAKKQVKRDNNNHKKHSKKHLQSSSVSSYSSSRAVFPTIAEETTTGDNESTTESPASSPSNDKKGRKKSFHLFKNRNKEKTAWKLNWIFGMLIVSIFVVIAAVVIARTANGTASNSSPNNNNKEDSSKVTINNGDQQYNNNDNTDNRSSRWASFDGIAVVTNDYQVVNVYDHDNTSFTQGLLVHNDQLVESTGMYGDSLVRRWDPETGEIFQEHKFDSKYFGEGMTWYIDEEGNERFVMLTWKEKTGFVFDASPGASLEPIRTFEYKTHTMEGWGITFDPDRKVFYVSDGSEYIMVWNVQFEEIDKFAVTLTMPHWQQQQQSDENGEQQLVTRKLIYLNELEWDGDTGTILANVLGENAIVRILPYSGKIAQVYDLTKLYPERAPMSRGEDVMNGIAKHATKANHWWITGKYWPKIFLVEFLS